MTIYYIDPAGGDDGNTGLSWGQAWRTLRGLRVASVVPGAGDEVRLAKSPLFVSAYGTHSTPTSGGYWPEWYMRGAPTFSCDGTTQQFKAVNAPKYPEAYVLRALSIVAGTLTPDMPAGWASWDNKYETLHATATGGEYNTPNSMLFGAVLASAIDSQHAQVMTSVRGAFRCKPEFSGAGTTDLPAGTLELRIYGNATLLHTLPLPALRNSSTEWTPFLCSLPSLASVWVYDLTVWVCRTSAPLARDTSAFGLEFSCFTFGLSWAAPMLQAVYEPARDAGGANTVEAVGNSSMRVLAERLGAGAYATETAISLGVMRNSRIAVTIPSVHVAYDVSDIAFTGNQMHSPPGARGVYDLNGSAGGTPLAPLLISGGWNTSTDVVDGVTAFTAGLPANTPSSFALFDMHGADYVKVTNVAAVYGFSSFFTRALHVHLQRCGLPWSISPAFGEATTETHVTLQDMYICPLLLEGFGTIGDLSLSNVYYASDRNQTYTERRNEVGNLTMYDAWMGVPANAGERPLYVRGNGDISQCVLAAPLKLVSIEFGHTLTYHDPKPLTNHTVLQQIRTAPESRWDAILYPPSTIPYGAFAPVYSTASTCDALVTMADDLLLAYGYPTAIRGNHTTHTYVDGLNAFLSSAPPSTVSLGHKYIHTSASHYSPGAGNLKSVGGDVAFPAYDMKYPLPGPPDSVATGRLALTLRHANVSYRTDADVFVTSFREYATAGYELRLWVALASLYVATPGMYRAHFGVMKEGIAFSIAGVYADALSGPTTMGTAAYGYEELLGRLAVFGAHLVGGPQEITLYAASSSEVQQGGGNTNKDEWWDYYIDFEIAAPCLVELRHGSNDHGTFNTAIFDTLAVYAR